VISRKIDYSRLGELADFDATSTTIAVSPVGEAGGCRSAIDADVREIFPGKRV